MIAQRFLLHEEAQPLVAEPQDLHHRVVLHLHIGVGLNETEAQEKGIEVEVTRYEFAELDRAVAESARKGFIKVLTPPWKDKILGVTIVSEHAGDLLAEFVIAMKHGLGLNKILGTIHTYPTWAEGAKYAAGNWKRANAPEKLLTYVEKFHAWRRG